MESKSSYLNLEWLFLPKVLVWVGMSLFFILNLYFLPSVFSLSDQRVQVALLAVLCVFYLILFMMRKTLQSKNIIFLVTGLEIIGFAVFSYWSCFPVNLLVAVLSLNILLSAFLFSRAKSFLVFSLSVLVFAVYTFLFKELLAQNLEVYFLVNFLSFGVYHFAARFFKKFFEKNELENLILTTKLFRQRAFNDTILSSIDYGVYLVDQKNQVLGQNKSAENFQKKFHLDSKILAAAKKGTSSFEHNNKNFKVYKTDWKEDLGQSAVVLVSDETQEVQLRKQLEQEKKLAAIGTLSAGLAHEIRNPLAGISGSIELLKEGGADQEISKRLFGTILREIDRLNLLITDFLGFARPEVRRQDVVDMKKFLEEIVDFLKKDSRSQNIELSLQADSFSLKVDENKLRQVFINLIINAFQAFTSEHKKEILAQQKSCSVEIWGKSLDQGYRIKVKDNGVGIKKEELDLIFEPFHTTKDKGTGLGLAVSHRILEGHGATVKVASVLGEGTEFDIFFKSQT